MNVSLSHHQPVNASQSNEFEDISSVVAQQLADLEKYADDPSEFSPDDAAHFENVKIANTVDDSWRDSIDVEYMRPLNESGGDGHEFQRQLKQATYQETVTKLHKHTSPSQKILRAIFDNSFLSAILDALRVTILRPLPLMLGSLSSLLISLIALMAAYVLAIPFYAHVVVIAFLTGYSIGLIIDLIQKRRVQFNS